MGEMSLDAQKEKQLEAKNMIYEAKLTLKGVQEEVSVNIEEDGLLMQSMFAQSAISFVDIKAITMQDYQIIIQVDNDSILLSGLKNKCEWCYQDILNVYQKKVKEALLIVDSPIYETHAICEAMEVDDKFHVSAKLEVYQDCLCIITADQYSRKIPFVFVNGLVKKDYTIELSLATSEKYIFSMLGYDLESFEKQIKTQLLELHKKASTFMKALDDTLSIIETAEIAMILQEGIAVSIDTIKQASISLAEKILAVAQEASQEYFSSLQQFGEMFIGIKKVQAKKNPKEIMMPDYNNHLEDIADTQTTNEQEENKKEQWLVFMVIHVPEKDCAIVELCIPNEASATYLYRVEKNFTQFIKQLNRGMVASDYRREIISMDDEKLQKADKENTRILLARTSALRWLRQRWIGKVIHSSLDSWQRNIISYMDKKGDHL